MSEKPDVFAKAEDIVPNREALSVAQSLLGIRSQDFLVQQAEHNGDEKPRPARLGLGARFLPHNKAVSLVGGVEKRLAAKVVSSQQKRLGDVGASTQERQSSKPNHQKRVPASTASVDDDGSDEDMSRARAFQGAGQARKVQQRPTALEPFPAAPSTQGDTPRRGRKKKRRKRSAQE
eukprot:CAMPEP_0177609436 /NCGR_PEP_ID=MMETSP0419_2-20121207/19089_1 /TAXON_ID=582737 /ORGANISM="Tetraselmis sp., Strain GSL018" /LENGTH=176 /DNA_ID=CAMNT_0019104363 /DNA_START=35 /DNA_END=565 /DNA_ORIENTATION=+